MNIQIKGKDVELKYTFNSFKHMADLDLGALATIDRKPFMMIVILEQLMMGAVNNSPKLVFSEIEVQEFLERYAEESDLGELVQFLIDQLQESSFFKSLQKK